MHKQHHLITSMVKGELAMSVPCMWVPATLLKTTFVQLEMKIDTPLFSTVICKAHYFKCASNTKSYLYAILTSSNSHSKLTLVTIA